MLREDALSHTGTHTVSSGRSLEPGRIAEVLGAVSAANEQFLVTLRESAFRNEPTFPLAPVVRRRLIEIPRAKLRDAAQCGVLLVDAHSAQVACARSSAHASQEPVNYSDTGGGAQPSVALAYSLLGVVWYVVHTTPAAAGVLLGMSAVVVEAFSTLSVGKLGFVARVAPNWVQPRWRDRPDVWMGILQIDDAAECRPPSIVLRCLKAAAADSSGLRPLIEAGT